MTEGTKNAHRALKILVMFKEFATPKYAWLAFGLVVALATAAFGGMAQVPAPPPRTGRAPAAVDAAPFSLKVAGGTVGDIAPGYRTPSAAERFIAVTLTVTNTTTEPVAAPTLASTLRLSGAKVVLRTKAAAPLFVRTHGGVLTDLQPGVPTQLVAYWAQPRSEPAPTSLALEVRAHTWRADSIFGSMFWADPTLIAVLDVALERAP